VLLVVSQTQVRSMLVLPRFLQLSAASVAQARESRGNLGARILPRAPLRWCTLTGWEDEAALLRYVREGSHAEAMRATRALTVTSRFARLLHDGAFDEVSWAQALAHLDGNGRVLAPREQDP
jgi:quinol monooxygenase YgiN